MVCFFLPIEIEGDSEANNLSFCPKRLGIDYGEYEFKVDSRITINRAEIIH